MKTTILPPQRPEQNQSELLRLFSKLTFWVFVFCIVQSVSCSKSGGGGSSAIITNGVATFEFTYEPGNGNDLYFNSSYGRRPTKALGSHAEEISEAVYKTATQHTDVTEIRIGITTTFPAYDHDDRYGHTHSIKAETLHTGYISVSNLSEIRKFTQKAFVNEDWYSSKIADLLNDTLRHEHPQD